VAVAPRRALPADCAAPRSQFGPERIADFIREQTGLSTVRLSRVAAVQVAPQATFDARERILDAAYELFSRRAIRDVGVDEVIERAGVAKATLYRHFSSKDDLVIAFLERREERWTLAWVEAEARRRGTTPEEQLLAIFEVFDEWFQRDDFEACSFINVLLEMGPAHPAGQASVRHLANIRTVVARLADEAALRDPESFARSWHILMKGSIVSATEGDAQAAERAQSMARLLIEQHR
jgi:AcrR family transcriptional regulator